MTMAGSVALDQEVLQKFAIQKNLPLVSIQANPGVSGDNEKALHMLAKQLAATKMVNGVFK
jgi:hypothetical protein